MSIIELLEENIAQYTKQQKHISTYEEHLKLLESYDITPSQMYRSIESVVYMTGWKTSLEHLQQLISVSLDYAKINAWKIPFPKTHRCDLHMHDHIELLYVVEGSLQIQIEGKDVWAQKGEIILISSEVKHQEYLKPEACVILCLGLNDSFFSTYMTEYEYADYGANMKNWIEEKRNSYLYMHFHPATEEIDNKMKETWTLFVKEMLLTEPGRRDIVIGCVKRLLDYLAKQHIFTIATKDKNDFQQVLCKDICLYIKNFYQIATVTKIGEVFHYTPDYLNRLFKNNFGMTISKYIQRIRLEEAARLLEHTDYSIEEISICVGYQNQGFFYQKFKEKYGVLPLKYRKEVIEFDSKVLV